MQWDTRSIEGYPAMLYMSLPATPHPILRSTNGFNVRWNVLLGPADLRPKDWLRFFSKNDIDMIWAAAVRGQPLL